MSATTVAGALHTRLSAVASLGTVLNYIPLSLQAPTVVYVKFMRFEQPSMGVYRWFFQVRLCVVFQENAGAEAAYLALLNVIPETIAADGTLGGVVSPGNAHITEGVGGMFNFGGKVYRTCDYEANILDKTGLA